MKAKNWWKNNSEKWLKQIKRYEKMDKGNSKSFKQEEDFLTDKILDYIFGNAKMLKILEVGAGDGRMIGRISEYAKCSSLDINPELSEYIKNKYQKIKTFVGEVVDLPFRDNKFDLVFTHEVIQHIEPREIKKAVSELKRVGKEFWAMESWRDNEENGKKVSNYHGGRWNWNLQKYFDCYYDFYTDWGQLFIKARK